MRLHLSDDEAYALWWRIMSLSADDGSALDIEVAKLIAASQSDLDAILTRWKSNRVAKTPEELVAAFPRFPAPNLLLARYIRFLATALMEADVDVDIPFQAKGHIYLLLVKLADTYKPPA